MSFIYCYCFIIINIICFLFYFSLDPHLLKLVPSPNDICQTQVTPHGLIGFLANTPTRAFSHACVSLLKQYQLLAQQAAALMLYPCACMVDPEPCIMHEELLQPHLHCRAMSTTFSCTYAEPPLPTCPLACKKSHAFTPSSLHLRKTIPKYFGPSHQVPFIPFASLFQPPIPCNCSKRKKAIFTLATGSEAGTCLHATTSGSRAFLVLLKREKNTE